MLTELPDWLTILEFGNLVLSSAILILSFSLFVYILTFNLHSRVGRAFAALLLGVIIVYSGDVVLPRVEWQESWLRFQWLGIALVPAAYLHFSRAVLLATSLRPDPSYWRWIVRGAYGVSGVFAFMAVATDILVQPAAGSFPVTYLQPGLLFPLFTLYFVTATLWGGWTLLQARAMARTMASRRRLNYLLWSFAAPALGVFPYLILVSRTGETNPALVLIFASIANVTVGIMLVVMAYSVAYYGVLSPDRVVKRQLIYFLLRGPIVAVIVIGLILSIPRVEAILGLPADTALTLFVVGVIVMAPLLLYVLQPWIDRAIYRKESDEVQWLRTLDQRLMTSSDLSQFLENVLVSLCDALEVNAGFVALPGETEARLEAVVGTETGARATLALPEVQRLLTAEFPDDAFHPADGYFIRTLTNRHTDQPLGIIALRSDGLRLEDFPASSLMVIEHLLRRAEIAVEDRRLQLDVFEALRPVLPDFEVMQALRGTVPYVIGGSESDADDLTRSPEFTEWVRDALNHFWGGPKLSDSPLLDLRVVKSVLADYENSPTRALRAVLQMAVERQRPAGDRQMTTSEWMLYNILDLKFLQGKRVREVANRLAMSESDLYRKQRVAISEVARTLADMEASADADGLDIATTQVGREPTGPPERAAVAQVQSVPKPG
ncbi:MAG: hypothetical protein J5I90_00265 [Caldilineales bacterium]|nr:hypothetical protein [Caldilineales bacterium]